MHLARYEPPPNQALRGLVWNVIYLSGVVVRKTLPYITLETAVKCNIGSTSVPSCPTFKTLFRQVSL